MNPKKKITDYVKKVAAITDVDIADKSKKSKENDILDLNKQINTDTGAFVFKDYENDLYFSKANLFMKSVLVYDKIPKMDWKIEKEKKEIGKFTCRKATTVHDNKQMIAWFTDEIPSSSGPNEFGGLPGLILKLEFADERVISVSRIVQNINLAFQFPKPEKKAGTINYAEFTEANSEIIGQLLEAFRSSKDGNIQININN